MSQNIYRFAGKKSFRARFIRFVERRAWLLVFLVSGLFWCVIICFVWLMWRLL